MLRVCSAADSLISWARSATADGGLGLVNNSVVIMSTIVALALGLGTVKTNSQIRT